MLIVLLLTLVVSMLRLRHLACSTMAVVYPTNSSAGLESATCRLPC